MDFTAHIIAEDARDAGLQVFYFDGYGHESSRLRISAGPYHLLVTTSWNGYSENITAAKFVDTESRTSSIPPFDQADRWTRTHHYAMLGWVVEQIQWLAQAQARDDQQEAGVRDTIASLKRKNRALRRSQAAWKREWKVA